MSIKESTVPNRERPFHEYRKESFSLHSIINDSIRKLQAHHPGTSMVLRCEVLPEAYGNRQELTEFFERLIGLIMAQPPNGSRLLLHIDCEHATFESNPARHQGISLKIHTNITTDDHWKLVNSQVLAQCKMIVNNHNGSLQVNQITGTGCLFSVSLPGKSQ